MIVGEYRLVGPCKLSGTDDCLTDGVFTICALSPPLCSSDSKREATHDANSFSTEKMGSLIKERRQAAMNIG